MKITNNEVIKILKKVKSYELEQRLEDYPEDEVDGRSDMEMLKNELDWLIDNFEDEGCIIHEALMEAKQIIRETKNGCIPLNPYTLKPKYKDYIIKQAHDDVNEYNRLKRLWKKIC